MSSLPNVAAINTKSLLDIALENAKNISSNTSQFPRMDSFLIERLADPKKCYE